MKHQRHSGNGSPVWLLENCLKLPVCYGNEKVARWIHNSKTNCLVCIVRRQSNRTLTSKAWKISFQLLVQFVRLNYWFARSLRLRNWWFSLTSDKGLACRRVTTKQKETPIKVLSTRSVRMNLARPFKAGKDQRGVRRRVATTETGFNCRYATRTSNDLIPALKRRAKFIATLCVEDL